MVECTVDKALASKATGPGLKFSHKQRMNAIDRKVFHEIFLVFSS